MKSLRTLSTSRLLVLVAVAVLAASAGTAMALGSRGGGPLPAAKPLPQAIRDGIAAKAPAGISARISFTNKLIPTDALGGGDHVSALLSGASGRLWLRRDHRGRLELQSNAGDVQIVWAPHRLTIYDASSNTLYRAALPARQDRGEAAAREHHGRLTTQKIANGLARLREHASVSGALPSDVGGRPAYTVSLGPKQNGGLLGKVELAWDALRGVPLRFGIYAKGSTSPVLELKVTDISYGPVPLSDVDLAPPAHAKVVTLSVPRGRHGSVKTARAQADFAVVAPPTLAGLARTDVHPLGRAVVVHYGEGLGSIVVLERKADTKHGKVFGSLPTVSLNGVTGHELSTQLGTAIAWERNGVAFVLAGSVPASTAEAAARGLG